MPEPETRSLGELLRERRRARRNGRTPPEIAVDPATEATLQRLEQLVENWPEFTEQQSSRIATLLRVGIKDAHSSAFPKRGAA